MDNKNIFASNLRRYMEQNGKSRKDVADAIGVSYYTFTAWVTGKKYPRMDKVELMANYFGILKSDLIEEKSVHEKINENPSAMAQLHFEMIVDEDLAELYEDFRVLSAKEKKIVKDLAHSLAQTDA